MKQFHPCMDEHCLLYHLIYFYLYSLRDIDLERAFRLGQSKFSEAMFETSSFKWPCLVYCTMRIIRKGNDSDSLESPWLLWEKYLLPMIQKIPLGNLYFYKQTFKQSFKKFHQVIWVVLGEITKYKYLESVLDRLD